MSTDIHPGLQLAREARMLGPEEGLRHATPSKLYARCGNDSTLYRHAMLEAGMLVDAKTSKPFDPCPECGWSPTGTGRQSE